MDSSPLTYASAEAVYAELERLRAAGILTDPAYRAQLNTLRIKDEPGRTWMLQERTGRWHMWERGAWVEATPPGREPPPIRTPAAPEPAPGVAALDVTALRPPTQEAVPYSVVARVDLPPAGVVPPPPEPDATTPLAEPQPPTAATLPGRPPMVSSSAVHGGIAAPPPAPVLPPPVALRTAPPPPSLPPPSALAATALNAVAQSAPGQTGKRARRDAQRAARTASRSRREFRTIAWSILKWDVLWCLAGWAVYSIAGHRAPWALIPVAALAIITLVIWIRRLPSRQLPRRRPTPQQPGGVI